MLLEGSALLSALGLHLTAWEAPAPCPDCGSERHHCSHRAVPKKTFNIWIITLDS